MRLCAAQFRSVAVDFDTNLRRHLAFVDTAASLGAALVCFPELSLTGYEPKLASSLATTPEDARLRILQQKADSSSITIAVGLPLYVPAGVAIAMQIFQPGQRALAYLKQQLHADELPWFVPGGTQVVFERDGLRIAPAICYESLQDSHAGATALLGADVYLASVVKSAGGLQKAENHYPVIARRHGMSVLMSNSIGPSDGIVAGGRSAAWSADGERLGGLDSEREGLLLFDVSTNTAVPHYLPQAA